MCHAPVWNYMVLHATVGSLTVEDIIHVVHIMPYIKLYSVVQPIESTME